jgi:hypothetical protein
MVDTSSKLDLIIHNFIEQGEYFTINRGRQYGKTTTLSLLERRLKDGYLVIRMSFEGRDEFFSSAATFALGFRKLVSAYLTPIDAQLAEIWKPKIDPDLPAEDLRSRITQTCGLSGKPVVLMIDETDRAADFIVFIMFLGLLRDLYLERNDKGTPAFQSVILAGIHDIKNLKKNIRPDSEHAYNSPWNIAANFDVDMSFSSSEIATMLMEYENDHHAGMDIGAVADRLHYYTGGYPFLVSRLCKMIADCGLDWAPEGVDGAVKKLIFEKNTLFDDLIKNVENNPAFADILRQILLEGKEYKLNSYLPEIDLGIIYGILGPGRENSNTAVITNIIFETQIYNYLTSKEEIAKSRIYSHEDRSLFIRDGKLDMDKVVERFAARLKTEYRDADSDFIERQCRLLFLCFLSPIINGTGQYVVEPQTRGNRRMDVVVFFGGEKYIVELKIWRGEAYETKGMDQLIDYLDSQEARKGWLVSFSTNRNAPRESRIFEYKGFVISETVIGISTGAASNITRPSSSGAISAAGPSPDHCP